MSPAWIFCTRFWALPNLKLTFIKIYFVFVTWFDSSFLIGLFMSVESISHYCIFGTCPFANHVCMVMKIFWRWSCTRNAFVSVQLCYRRLKGLKPGAQNFGFFADSFFALVRYLLHAAGPPRSEGPAAGPYFFLSFAWDYALTPTEFSMTFWNSFWIQKWIKSNYFYYENWKCVFLYQVFYADFKICFNFLRIPSLKLSRAFLRWELVHL